MALTRELCEAHLASDLAKFCWEGAQREHQPAAISLASYLLLEIVDLFFENLHLPAGFEGEIVGDIFSAMCTIATDDALNQTLGGLFDETERKLAPQYCERVW